MKMAAPISIIIPTFNSAARIAPCLDALTRGVMEGLVGELIFADAGSTDDLIEVADAVGAHMLAAPKGKELQAGVAVARCRWVLALPADHILSPDWPHAVVAHFSHPDALGYFQRAGLLGRFAQPALRTGLLVRRELALGGWRTQRKLEARISQLT